MSRLQQQIPEPRLNRPTNAAAVCFAVTADCDERDALINACRIATAEYSRMAGLMRSAAGVNGERIRQRCEVARQELANHVWEHGCQFGRFDF